MVGIIVKLLRANVAIASKIESSNIVPLTMPQGMHPPCLIYFTETEPIIGCDSGGSITRANVTIQVVSNTMAELLELSPEVINALKGKSEANLLHCSLVDAGSDDFDEDNSYYFRSIQFNCISEI